MKKNIIINLLERLKKLKIDKDKIIEIFNYSEEVLYLLNKINNDMILMEGIKIINANYPNEEDLLKALNIITKDNDISYIKVLSNKDLIKKNLEFTVYEALKNYSGSSSILSKYLTNPLIIKKGIVNDVIRVFAKVENKIQEDCIINILNNENLIKKGLAIKYCLEMLKIAYDSELSYNVTLILYNKYLKESQIDTAIELLKDANSIQRNIIINIYSNRRLLKLNYEYKCSKIILDMDYNLSSAYRLMNDILKDKDSINILNIIPYLNNMNSNQASVLVYVLTRKPELINNKIIYDIIKIINKIDNMDVLTIHEYKLAIVNILSHNYDYKYTLDALNSIVKCKNTYTVRETLKVLTSEILIAKGISLEVSNISQNLVFDQFKELIYNADLSKDIILKVAHIMNDCCDNRLYIKKVLLATNFDFDTATMVGKTDEEHAELITELFLKYNYSNVPYYIERIKIIVKTNSSLLGYLKQALLDENTKNIDLECAKVISESPNSFVAQLQEDILIYSNLDYVEALKGARLLKEANNYLGYEGVILAYEIITNKKIISYNLKLNYLIASLLTENYCLNNVDYINQVIVLYPELKEEIASIIRKRMQSLPSIEEKRFYFKLFSGLSINLSYKEEVEKNYDEIENIIYNLEEDVSINEVRDKLIRNKKSKNNQNK